ncbi:hypothetical protein Tco_1209080, partial [Tanacetum coccineum]
DRLNILNVYPDSHGVDDVSQELTLFDFECHVAGRLSSLRQISSQGFDGTLCGHQKALAGEVDTHTPYTIVILEEDMICDPCVAYWFRPRVCSASSLRMPVMYVGFQAKTNSITGLILDTSILSFWMADLLSIKLYLDVDLTVSNCIIIFFDNDVIRLSEDRIKMSRAMLCDEVASPRPCLGTPRIVQLLDLLRRLYSKRKPGSLVLVMTTIVFHLDRSVVKRIILAAATQRLQVKKSKQVCKVAIEWNVNLTVKADD